MFAEELLAKVRPRHSVDLRKESLGFLRDPRGPCKGNLLNPMDGVPKDSIWELLFPVQRSQGSYMESSWDPMESCGI